MQNIIEAPAVIIPFDVFKLKVLEYLAYHLYVAVQDDFTDHTIINTWTETMHEFLIARNDYKIVELVKDRHEDLFEPLFSKFENAIAVFVEINGDLISLCKTNTSKIAMCSDAKVLSWAFEVRS
jgi:hypothetical protein